jgi:epoxyqueuosine reductase
MSLGDFTTLRKQGCKLSIVSTRHLANLKSEIESRRNAGEFDEVFAKEHLNRFNFKRPPQLDNTQSIIVVAMPRPPTKAIFNWRAKKHTFVLPPTYTAYDEKRIHIEHLVGETVAKRGYKIATPNLPLKLLAIRSGLATYGRNNIAYVDGMGSFMRLTAVYSDMPPLSENWRANKMMDHCEGCDLCQRACPTGAIGGDRFLLHAERCLTLHNERNGIIPFPDWIKPQWHNALIGCIRCQTACPVNKPYLCMVGETAEFSEEETALLLKGIKIEQVPTEMVAKLKLLSITDFINEMPRNLSVLLQNAK